MDSFFVDLNHLDFISVTGKDSEKFLQGQLTCDIESLSNEKSSLGAACDNKGRVLANFRIIKSHDSFHLEMQNDVAGLLKPILEKYKVFFDCVINDNSEYQRYGLVGDQSINFLSSYFPTLPTNINQVINQDDLILFKLSDTPVSYELWLKPLTHQKLLSDLNESLPKKNGELWKILEIQQGLFQIETHDSGLYTPQSLNFDLAHLISFSKGCYTGQEIVARMHYRGQAKKRLYRLLIESQQAVNIGHSVVIDNGKILGKILKIQKAKDDNYESLAILSSVIEDSEETDKLTILECHDSRVTVAKLDYKTAPSL